MRHDQPYLGKFEGNGSRRLAAALYDLAGDGSITELGDVQGFGWYGLVRRRNHGYILQEDNYGFFSYVAYPTIKALDKAWAELETEYDEFNAEDTGHDSLEDN